MTSAAMTRFSRLICTVQVSQQDSGLFFNAGVKEAAVSAQERQLGHEKQLCASVNHDICE